MLSDMQKTPDRPIYTNERALPNNLLTIAKEHPRIAAWILAGLTAVGVATYTNQDTKVSAAEAWRNPTSQEGGTVPEPTPDPYESWNTYAIGVKDQNGNIPKQGYISAYRTFPDGHEETILYRNNLEQGQPFHNLGFPQHPGEEVRIEVEVPSQNGEGFELLGISNVKAPVNEVVIQNEAGQKDGALNISTVDTDIQVNELPASVVTTTLNTEVDAMHIDIDSPLGSSSLGVNGLEGTLNLDVVELSRVQTKLARAADSTSPSESYDLGTLSGSADGIEMSLSVNGETFIFESGDPLEGTHNFSLNENGLSIEGYGKPDTPKQSSKIFLPSLKN